MQQFERAGQSWSQDHFFVQDKDKPRTESREVRINTEPKEVEVRVKNESKEVRSESRLKPKSEPRNTPGIEGSGKLLCSH